MLGQNLNLKLRDKTTMPCILHTQIRSKFHFLSDGKSVLLTGVVKFLVQFHWSRSHDFSQSWFGASISVSKSNRTCQQMIQIIFKKGIQRLCYSLFTHSTAATRRDKLL